MHAYIIAGNSWDIQKEEIEKLLKSHAIDPIDISQVSIEDEKETIGIGQIRKLQRSVLLRPFKGEGKAVIIENAQALTVEAQNALLKTLEEPPANTILILLTNSADSLLPTIVSRCQVIELTTNYSQLTSNGLAVISKQLEVISQGKIGDRLELAEQISKDKQTAIEWLTNMIFTTRQNLLNAVSKDKNDPSISTLLNFLISFQHTRTLLSTTNVNARLTLETLFLTVD